MIEPMSAERLEWMRHAANSEGNYLIRHKSLELLAEVDRARAEIERLKAQRDEARAERDQLLGHGGSEEVNSLALLDLYQERAVAAEQERDEALVTLEHVTRGYDRLKARPTTALPVDDTPPSPELLAVLQEGNDDARNGRIVPLPATNPDDERIVDALVAKATSDKATRPLPPNQWGKAAPVHSEAYVEGLREALHDVAKMLGDRARAAEADRNTIKGEKDALRSRCSLQRRELKRLNACIRVNNLTMRLQAQSAVDAHRIANERKERAESAERRGWERAIRAANDTLGGLGYTLAVSRLGFVPETGEAK